MEWPLYAFIEVIVSNIAAIFTFICWKYCTFACVFMT